MAEPPKPPEGSGSTKAPKDRTCEYCGQNFTSSSLGRHLDQFIKEKNPKQPDGVHDVERIRKIRGGITRRQHRGSMVSMGGQTNSNSGGTATGRSKQSSGSEGPLSPSIFKSPDSVKGGDSGSRISRGDPFNAPWHTTGARSNSQRGPTPRLTADYVRRRRNLEENARATELALRDLISSLRAGKRQININSMPFDVDPLTLDFPALVLRFLPATGTLFASIPMSTPTSWAIEPPGQDQLDALRNYFLKEINKWKTSCAVAATAASEEVAHLSSGTPLKPDTKEEIRKAERRAEELEGKIFDHLQSTFRGWSEMREPERDWYWRLELARGISRNQKQVDELKVNERDLRRENDMLRSQLFRLQQPREPGVMLPSTIHFEEKVVDFLAESGRHELALMLEDPDFDLDTVVTKFIGRWKGPTGPSRSPTSRLNSLQLPRNINTGASETGVAVGATANATISPRKGQPQTNPFHTQQQQQQQQSVLQNQPQRKTPELIQAEGTAQLYAGASSTESQSDPNANQDGDEGDNTDGDGEDNSDADGDADGDEDGDVDSDIDADGDAEMEDLSPYNTNTTIEGVSRQQEYIMPSQQQQEQPQQQHTISPEHQNHALSPQQHYQHHNPPGPIRSRVAGSQARFNPFQNSPSVRNVTAGRGITTGSNASRVAAMGVTGASNPMQMLNRSVSGGSNMATLHNLGGEVGGGTTGHHQQYMNTLGGNHSHLTGSGMGQGLPQGLPQGVSLGQPVGQGMSHQATGEQTLGHEPGLHFS